MASGDGRILGTINGSPFNEPRTDPDVRITGPTFPAHYGVVRAFVQSTRICTGTDAERALLKAITVDAGRGGASRVGDAGCATDHAGGAEILVHARAEGLPVAALRIPLTNDPSALPLAVAAAL